MSSARTRSGPAPVEWPEERQQQKQLSNLFTSGSKLSEVPPDFRGIEYGVWRGLRLRQMSADYAPVREAKPMPESNRRWVGNKIIATARDGYGI